MVYDLPVVDEKVKPHQVTTLHLITGLAFLAAGAIILDYNYTIPMWGLALLLVGLGVIGLTIFRNRWTTSRAVNPKMRLLEFLVAATIGGYSFYQHWKFPQLIFGVLSCVLIFAILWERTAWDKLFIHVDADGVKLPVTSRKRFLEWKEIEQIVFRFGTISIDCVDNRLFQWTLDETDIKSEPFEDFCAAQVELNRDKRRSDDL